MNNYLDIIDNYLKERNNLLRFNSFSNDVRLYDNHIIKFFCNKERLEKESTGLHIMRNTSINVPTVEFVYPEKKILIEDYIDGIALNEYTIFLSKRTLYDIGKLMGTFHNINVSSKDGSNSWIATILSDMVSISDYLAPYNRDFESTINFVNEECKRMFSNLHFTYVHGDFKPSNIVWSETNNRYYLIDFENFMIGDPMLDIYKMLSIIKSNDRYTFEDAKAFLDGYKSVRPLTKKLIENYTFYDAYYSLRSVRRAVKGKYFRANDDSYVHNADLSAQMKNPKTFVVIGWLKKYYNFTS